jgi:hypothetical protein
MFKISEKQVTKVLHYVFVRIRGLTGSTYFDVDKKLESSGAILGSQV